MGREKDVLVRAVWASRGAVGTRMHALTSDVLVDASPPLVAPSSLRASWLGPLVL